MTIQMKATEQYFPVVLFIILYKVVQTIDESVKITCCTFYRIIQEYEHLF